MHDAAIIGGSFAGISAALQLARAHRKVLVIDAGQRRNRFASHSHGFLGQDGVDPASLWSGARRQLQAYPTVMWTNGKAAAIAGTKDNFEISTEDSQVFSSRRILFATGVTDHLPEIPGLSERWGQSVFHCPYCHGYELNKGRIGVIAFGAMSLHQAQLLPDWGQVTFLTNGTFMIEPDQRDELKRRDVLIEETVIGDISGSAEVNLQDGRSLSFDGLFVATRTTPASSLPAETGCALMDSPLGTQIKTSEAKETTVPGIFACGDVARAPHSLALAVADGAWAGAQVHRSLVWPES
ncbi:MAG: NAD(P)/FAD-dependent oxidoreductase [Rhizobiaceae bacterium]